MPQIELKKKVTKLDVIITAIDPLIDGVDSYTNASSSAAITVVHSPIVPVGTWPAKVNGLNIVTHKSFPPSFATVLGEYLTRIRGNATVGFVRPGYQVNPDLGHLFRHADEQRMERTYGFYVLGKDWVPVMFGFTGNVAEFMFHAIHHTVKFGDTAWAIAVHAWAKKGLMTHRYFDATNMNVVLPKEEVVEAAPVKEEEYIKIPEVAVVQPVKKARGRPRKAK